MPPKFDTTQPAQEPMVQPSQEGVSFAPKGWYTNTGISKILNVSQTAIENIAKKYRETNKEWFKDYKDETGRT